ncbi:MAG: sulfatase-like hydrolase/transferase [Planctomycetes bacterium]|nr:sulfatase-like hydrolase/transferase [Planctomycetota bacterium]
MSSLCSHAGRLQAAAHPNFVVIMADDLGYGDLSSYGGWIETPRLDKLAAEGMKFTDFHSSGNVCSPTRAGLMTGRYQQRAGIPGVVFADPTRAVHYHGLQTSELTFAELLRESGYSTAMFGKWHLGYYPKYNPIHHGFDLFCGYVSGNVDFISHVDQAGTYDWWHQDKHAVEEGYTTHLITRHAVEFIEANKSKPFCLYLPHEAPHYPYQGPNDPKLRSVGGAFDTQGERTDIKDAYREMVQEMDKGVGEVVDAVQRLGLAENTLILFFSDNGANKNGDNGPLRGAKGSNWEGGHRVPCIARWTNKIAPGAVCDDLAISLDVMPTLLAAAEVTTPDAHKLDGVNLLPVMADGQKLGDRKLVWNGKAIRNGSWKLIVDGKGGEKVGLYDLDRDLGEKSNLASTELKRAVAMLAALENWKADVESGDSVQPNESAERQAAQASASAPKRKQKKK